MSLGMTYSPIIPGGGAASYKLRPGFTYSNGHWEVFIRFQGDFICFGVRLRGGGYVGRIFPWRNMSRGKKNSMKRAQDFLALL